MRKNLHLAFFGLANIGVMLFLFSCAQYDARTGIPTDLPDRVGNDYINMQMSVPDLVRLAIYAQNEEVRAAALGIVLWTVGLDTAFYPGEVYDTIEDALLSGTEEQKQVAFFILSESDDFAAGLIPMLLHIVRNDPNGFGPQAAHVLGQTGWRKAAIVPELLAAYRRARDSNNVAMRAGATYALGRFQVAEVLSQLVEDTTSEIFSVRLGAVNSLGHYAEAPDSAIEALCSVVENEPNQIIKSEAVKSLANLNRGQNALVAQAMLDALDDERPIVQRATITTIRRLKISNANVLEKLINMAPTTNALLYYEVMDALEASGDDGIPVFRQVLKNGEYEKKTVAAEVLARISANSVKVLVDSHLNGEFAEAHVATTALGKAHALVHMVEPVLLNALERNYQSYHALRALVMLQYKSNRWVSTVAKIVRDPTYDEPTRTQALRVIREFELTGSQIENALEIAAQDENTDLSAEAKGLLKQLNRKSKR
jgi:HEAT repeat protein